MAITCPVNDTTGVCGLMEGAGAGLGIFIQYMGQALPTLLLILVIVAVVSAVGLAIASLVSKGISKTHVK